MSWWPISHRPLVLAACMVALLGVLLAGTAAAQAVDPAKEPTAQVRFVHALPGAAPVDIYLAGERIVGGLPAGEATAYGLTRAGKPELVVRIAGSGAALLIRQSLTLEGGHSYTVAVGPTAAGGTAGYLFEDDTAPRPDSQSSVRVINLARGQPAIAAAINEMTLEGLYALGEGSARVDVGRGSRSVRILNNAGAEVARTAAIPLNNGEFYTVFVVGHGGNVQLLVLSYALTSGSVPTSRIWLPLSSAGGSSVASAAAPTPQPSAETQAARTLPDTGAGPDRTLPILFVVDGLLLGALGFAWLTWRRTVSRTSRR